MSHINPGHYGCCAMSKLYNTPINVQVDKNNYPCLFRWLGKWYRIVNCTVYNEPKHWWERCRNLEPARYRCETLQGMICDLYFKEETGWVLEKVWD